MEYQGGLRHGEFLVRRAGRIVHEGAYFVGAPWGGWLRYSPDGARVEEGAYVDGKKDGPWSRFWADGTPRAHATYVSGKRHGLSTWWRRDGELWVSGSFWRDAREGVWRRVDADGRELRGLYKRGRLASGDEVPLTDVDPGAEAVAASAAERRAR
jgi:antitoxin component YwqK of YwqJK toxin-antitoxin module